MIEINLSPREKDTNLANVGGFNLSLLNIKMLILSIVLLYAIEPFVLDFYQEKLDDQQKMYKKLKSEQRKIKDELTRLDYIKTQVEELLRQEVALSNRIQAVQAIVAKRQNPYRVFKYVAENTPDEIWITELQIEDRGLIMVGYSKDWKSIGEFLNNLKSSVFFGQNVNYEKPPGQKTEHMGQRVEPFQINASVERFQ